VKSRHGLSLGNTLIVVAVAATLAFTIAAASLTHLNYSTRVKNGILAQNIAESTLSLVVERLLSEDQRELGTLRDAASSQEFALSGGTGRLTFNKQQAETWKVPVSSNNLSSDSSMEGHDPTLPIPKNSAQLVASGTFNGVRRTVEAVLYVPPFPYAVASAGPFHSDGHLEVGALDTLPEAGAQPSSEEILSANLASNAPGAESLVLGPESRVSGDVRSPGGVKTDKTVYIGGQIRSGADPIQIPKENVTSYDPELLGKPNLQTLPSGDSSKPTIQGFAKVKGNLDVSGGLKLDNGVLYVDGDLHIEGGITGKGALFVTRNLTLSGATQMQTDNKVAVLAGGDVAVYGSGTYSSLFQGLLYNEGSFKAERITLMGVFIQNNAAKPVEISDARVYYSPTQGSLDLVIQSAQEVDLSKGNLRIKPILSGLLSPVLGQGEAVFEAYPVTHPAGSWELVDPNSKRILSLPNQTAVRAKVKEIWNASGSSTSGGLLGYGSDGKAAVLVVPPISLLGDLLFSAQFDSLGSVQTREPGSSQMLARTAGERFVVDPSQFLSLKDRVRLLYWRSR
jgi:hypothetical protein